ncbi:trypsin-like serine peptidase [Scytonema sp. NUACC26]|uniref:trypsin-like serine peptidase n=1 Tax=Scytonema sp. NUACC26 TaxID=3140176 RepID=UPI0034DC495B
MLPKNLLQDKKLIEEIFDRATTIFEKKQVPQHKLNASEVQEFLKVSGEEGSKSALDKFPEDKARLAEAIILTIGRPAILIKNNTFEVDVSDEWAKRLEAARANVEKAIRSVGRIEVTNHPRGLSYLGTGWLVAPDVIVTNRHIAEAFARKQDGSFVIKRNSTTGMNIGVNIDFREEFQVNAQEHFEVLEVLYIEEDLDDKPDIAFLKVSTKALVRGAVVNLSSTPIPLTNTLVQDESEVAAIGYPAEDSRRNPLPDPDMNKIFGDIYDVKRLQPGQIKSVRPDLITHDCSTLGGNSGSVVIDLQSGSAVGLHFGGKFMVENYAVPAAIIRERMQSLGI